MPTIRMFLSYALQHNHEIKQLDVPSAFLNGELKNDIYIKIPEGVKEINNKVLKLNKALYGLREAPRVWNDCFNNFMEEKGLHRSKTDACLYIGNEIKLVIWVDDVLMMGNEEKMKKLKLEMKKKFNIKDLGVLKTFLGTEIIYEKDCIKLSQQKLIKKILQRFKMGECKPTKTPMETNCYLNGVKEDIDVPYREVIGSLNYLAMISRPDIAYATSYLGRFLDKPSNDTWKAAKRILRYIKGTPELTLTFNKNSREQIVAYADADWGSDKIDRKSTTGTAIFYNGNLISWASKKQGVVAISTAESEYYAAATCGTEILFLRGLLEDFTGICPEAHLMMDNQSTLEMVQSRENTKRSKHIDIKAHFIKDIISKGYIKPSYISTNENIADIFTKPLSYDKFSYFRKGLGVM